MRLTGAQVDQLQKALLDAFDEAALRQMVHVGLGVDLAHVAGGAHLAEIVENLSAWAERENRVQALIDAAVAAVPTNDQLQALRQAAQNWHLAAPEGQEEPPPYKGMDFFDVDDASLFWGRERVTAGLVAYLCHHRLLAVVGASGSGKSSLVRAGVVPALQTGKHLQAEDKRPAGSQCWPVHILRPSDHPLESLALELIPRDARKTAITELMDDMAKDPRSLHLHVRQLLRQDREGERLLLVVDQFEELFTLCRDRDERKAFVDNLLTAAAPDGATTLILTLRADFYHRCAEFDTLRQALESNQRYIGAMSKEELRLAIEAPAAQGGWDLEPGLVDLMLDDVADEPGSLPLLSQALLETWKRRSGRLLTLAGYQASGRVQGAIAKTADSTYADLTSEQQAIARNIFLRLTELGEGVQYTRRRARMDELVSAPEAAPEVETVLQRLEDARLISTARTVVDEAPIHYVDVAHEALIRGWPALREWLAEDWEGLQVHRRLTEAAKEWERLDEDPGALYRGLRLEQTLAWAQDHAADLNDQERAFLAASQASVEAEKAERKRMVLEREEAVQRELKATRALAEEAEARRAAEQARAEEAEKREREAVARAKAEKERADQAEKLAAAEARSRKLFYGLLGVTAFALFVTMASAGFYYQQYQDLRGAELLREARKHREIHEWEEAKAKFRKAALVDSTLNMEVSKEISETSRSEALHLVYEGELLAFQGDMSSAEDKFRKALDLKPPPDTPVYVWISAGEFLMGSDLEMDIWAEKDEFARQPKIAIDGFWIMRTEVTNEQYKRCVDAKVCERPFNERWHRAEYAREPVTTVTWNEAMKYAAWVGGRLPTEAEWEMACRGTDGRIYPWGNESPEPARLDYVKSGLSQVTPVGSYAPGANGLFDMAGNVWEWTSSKYDQKQFPYPYRRDDGREDPGGDDFRVLRGGGWLDTYTSAPGARPPETKLRCASRNGDKPTIEYINVGFRVVVSPGR